MMHRTLLVLALILALAACEKKQISPDEFDPDRGIVFPATKAATLTLHCGEQRLASDGSWTPTSADIARLEAKLAPLLAVRLRALPPSGQKRTVVAYYRQYGGLIVGGTKIIFVNGFRENRVEFSPDPGEWRRDPVTVCGGVDGEWYFTALYNPQADQIDNLQFSP